MVLACSVVDVVAVVAGSLGIGIVVVVVVTADSPAGRDPAATERSESDPPPSEHALSRQATAAPPSSRLTGLELRPPTIAESVSSALTQSSEPLRR